jgi:hypothetical protein
MIAAIYARKSTDQRLADLARLPELGGTSR